MDERRLYSRHNIESLVVMDANGYSINGFLRNLSYGGCCFIGFDAIDELVKNINLTLNKPGVFNYILEGEIVRRSSRKGSNKIYYEFGIKFSNPDLNKDKIKIFFDEVFNK